MIAKYSNTPIEQTINADIDLDDLPRGTTRDAIVKVRVNQGFFRATVLSSYNLKCCITGIDLPELLVASHIMPWAKNEHARLHRTNGLCLNVMHDKAFDRGLITLTYNYEIKLSSKPKNKRSIDINKWFSEYENKIICLPDRFISNAEYLSYH